MPDPILPLLLRRLPPGGHGCLSCRIHFPWSEHFSRSLVMIAQAKRPGLFPISVESEQEEHHPVIPLGFSFLCRHYQSSPWRGRNARSLPRPAPLGKPTSCRSIVTGNSGHRGGIGSNRSSGPGRERGREKRMWTRGGSDFAAGFLHPRTDLSSSGS